MFKAKWKNWSMSTGDLRFDKQGRKIDSRKCEPFPWYINNFSRLSDYFACDDPSEEILQMAWQPGLVLTAGPALNQLKQLNWELDEYSWERVCAFKDISVLMDISWSLVDRNEPEYPIGRLIWNRRLQDPDPTEVHEALWSSAASPEVRDLPLNRLLRLSLRVTIRTCLKNKKFADEREWHMNTASNVAQGAAFVMADILRDGVKPWLTRHVYYSLLKDKKGPHRTQSIPVDLNKVPEDLSFEVWNEVMEIVYSKRK